MNKAFYLLYLGLVSVSCQSDNFYQTTRYFITDKQEYNVGEIVVLEAFIKPEKDQKSIRFYRNFKNLQISFTLMNDSAKKFNSEWTAWTGENLSETDIIEYSITQEKPFQKTYKIRIEEEGDSLTLSIPEMNYHSAFESKLVFDKRTIVRIHGFCSPIDPEIGASLEEYFDVKDIRINK